MPTTFKSGFTNFFIEGGAASGSMELYNKATKGEVVYAHYASIWGHAPIIDAIPLHVKSGRDFQTVNLYVGGLGEEVTGSTKLFTYGEGSGIGNPSGAYNVANLFLQVSDEQSESMNLIARGPSLSGVSTKSLATLLGHTLSYGEESPYDGIDYRHESLGAYQSNIVGLSLYLDVNPLFNETGTEVTGKADLFIENKLVISSGYIPIVLPLTEGVAASGNMSLFMARDIESVKDTTSLYTIGPITGPTGVATLYSAGEIRTSSGNITIAIPGVISSASGDETLYTFGHTT